MSQGAHTRRELGVLLGGKPIRPMPESPPPQDDDFFREHLDKRGSAVAALLAVARSLFKWKA